MSLKNHENNNFNFIDVLPYFKGRNNLFFKKIYTLQKKGTKF